MSSASPLWCPEQQNKTSSQTRASSKQKSLADFLIKHSWQANRIRMFPKREEEKEEEEDEEDESVKYDFMTPICHCYIWTHTSAGVLVSAFHISFTQQAEKKAFSLKIHTWMCTCTKNKKPELLGWNLVAHITQLLSAHSNPTVIINVS